VINRAELQAGVDIPGMEMKFVLLTGNALFSIIRCNNRITRLFHHAYSELIQPFHPLSMIPG